MPSGTHIFAGATLNVLQDVANGSNIPALQPLVSLAARIYTSAEGLKKNKEEAMELAECIRKSMEDILMVYPAPGFSPLSPQDLEDYGIAELQRALEKIATLVKKIGQQSRLRGFFTHALDKEELSKYGAKVLAAKVDFLFAVQLAQTKIRQLEQYPVFTKADLEPQEVLNPTKNCDTREIASLHHQKPVIVLRYKTKPNFLEDLNRLKQLEHPNLPFLGASSLTSPSPFIVMETEFHRPAKEFIRTLYNESPIELQRITIQIISGLLGGIDHLRRNNIALSGLADQMSNIQFDGRKLILNVDLPCKPLPLTDPFTLSAFMNEIFDSKKFLKNFDWESVLDIHEQEDDVLEV
ncbi:hypothetical protein B0H19DRAFT_445673 [Mycena capillaripes]|nr:hypothetical protein B0H19DRAFT_445673 [Mycena capillaripes]